MFILLKVKMFIYTRFAQVVRCAMRDHAKTPLSPVIMMELDVVDLTLKALPVVEERIKTAIGVLMVRLRLHLAPLPFV